MRIATASTRRVASRVSVHSVRGGCATGLLFCCIAAAPPKTITAARRAAAQENWEWSSAQRVGASGGSFHESAHGKLSPSVSPLTIASSVPPGVANQGVASVSHEHGCSVLPSLSFFETIGGHVRRRKHTMVVAKGGPARHARRGVPLNALPRRAWLMTSVHETPVLESPNIHEQRSSARVELELLPNLRLQVAEHRAAAPLRQGVDDLEVGLSPALSSAQRTSCRHLGRSVLPCSDVPCTDCCCLGIGVVRARPHALRPAAAPRRQLQAFTYAISIVPGFVSPGAGQSCRRLDSPTTLERHNTGFSQTSHTARTRRSRTTPRKWGSSEKPNRQTAAQRHSRRREALMVTRGHRTVSTTTARPAPYARRAVPH